MVGDQHERQQQLRGIRIRALEALRDHGPLRPLEIARWACIGRGQMAAVIWWAAWTRRGYIVRKGRRYVLLPDGEAWLRAARGPQRVGRW